MCYGTIYVQVKVYDQMIYKPGSVLYIKSGDYSSRTYVTISFKRPTQTTTWKRVFSQRRGCLYSVLLPVGFTLPLLLPVMRCALTDTISPLPKDRRYIFCGTFPKVSLAGCYPALCFQGARTFLYHC